MTLTLHDAHLLSAAAGVTLATVGSGDAGAAMLKALSIVKPGIKPLLADGLLMLSSAKDVPVQTEVEPSLDVLKTNLERLKQVAIDLLTTAETSQESFQSLEVEGPKQYRLWLSHEEIHLVFWALCVAQAIDEQQVNKAHEAAMAYSDIRRGVLGKGYEAFQDKFDRVHEQARVDDGEVL